MKTVAGIFVGGAGRRMGGVPKGMLLASGTPIAARLRDLAAPVVDEIVLVGESEAYASLGMVSLADAAEGAGPLAGLVSLLRHAGEGRAIALACDMPFVTRALLERLASLDADATVLAPRSQGRWEPLFARYDARGALPAATSALAARSLSLQPLLDGLGARELSMSDGERAAMKDWDRPGDLP